LLIILVFINLLIVYFRLNVAVFIDFVVSYLKMATF